LKQVKVFPEARAMASERICAECGAPLPKNAPGGRCPKCLLLLGLEEAEDDPTDPRSKLRPGQRPGLERPGMLVGRYKLLEQIGEGGFGIVFMAEQTEPVQRKVALKVLKAGMDTRQVVCRFEVERQTLAMLDHPNIAKVLDAGATDLGRPYFVMELVAGIRITDYCDQNQLSTAERLDLFIQVCRAIQHAHQKGIIHRDIKPSNILITLQDGEPMPKVIDFGIAKATEGPLTEQKLTVGYGAFVGTPAYTSPEQGAMHLGSTVDIDTRSDIYSLGVLLHELLVGNLPFEPSQFQPNDPTSIWRTIQEKQPQPPSTLLGTLSASQRSAVARSRRSDPSGLAHLVRGDLDWIVLKCLEKDRARRYETVNGLARDIERYLHNEPVVARPPSKIYLLRKMLRRNRLAFAAAGAVTMALAIGVAAIAWDAIRARQAGADQTRLRIEAEREKQNALIEAGRSAQLAQLLKSILESVGPAAALGRDTKLMHEILDKAAVQIGEELKNQPSLEAEMRDTIGEVYRALGDFQTAAAMHSRALNLRLNLFGPEHELVAQSMYHFAMALWGQGKFAEAEEMHRRALAVRRKLHGDENADVANSLSNLARVLRQEGKLTDAEDLLNQALAIRRKLFSEESLPVADSLSGLGGILWSQHRLAEAEDLHRQDLAMRQKLLGKHPDVARSLNNLGVTLRDEGRLIEAEDCLSRALAMRRDLLDPQHPDLAVSLNDLAGVLMRQGKAADAEPMAREALAIREKKLPEDWRTFSTRSLLGGILLAQQKREEGIPLAVSGYSGLLERKDRIPSYDSWILDDGAKYLAIALQNVATDVRDTPPHLPDPRNPRK
jgi:serine/threonine protein kinase/Tfp pilus assembly protein PilF